MIPGVELTEFIAFVGILGVALVVFAALEFIALGNAVDLGNGDEHLSPYLQRKLSLVRAELLPDANVRHQPRPR